MPEITEKHEHPNVCNTLQTFAKMRFLFL